MEEPAKASRPEESALLVEGLVRPFTLPEKATQLKWWEPDIESIRLDAQDRLLQGRGARAIVDPQLPADAKSKGIGN